MDEEDFLALRQLIVLEFHEIGLGALAEEEYYLVEDDPGADSQPHSYLPNPRTHVVQLLQAFRRHVAVQNGALATTALASINETVENEGPRSFLALPNSRLTDTDRVLIPDGEAVDLAALSDRTLLLEEIDSLLAELREAGEGDRR